MSAATRAASTARTVLRPARLTDLPLLVRHRRAMFRDIGVRDRKLLARADRDFARWLRPLLKRGEYAAFLVETPDGIPAASGGVWLQPRQPRPGFPGGGEPYLMSMYTEAAFRGRGIAARIVKAALKWCRARGFRTMTLHASPMGRSVYRKLGWSRTWEMKRTFTN